MYLNGMRFYLDDWGSKVSLKIIGFSRADPPIFVEPAIFVTKARQRDSD